MQQILKIVGRIGLLVTIVPALLFLMGWISLDVSKTLMIVGTIMWLVAAPLVQKMNKKTV